MPRWGATHPAAKVLAGVLVALSFLFCGGGLDNLFRRLLQGETWHAALKGVEMWEIVKRLVEFCGPI